MSAAIAAAVVAPLVGGTARADGAAPAPEADVSHHGYVTLRGSALDIRLRSENRGPSDLDGVTVRVRLSAELAGPQELPGACLRADPQTVLCRTGPLHADGVQQRRIALGLRLRGEPDQVVVRVGTAWNGGATDRDTGNDEHEVLALATGDTYVF
ncbi:MULTISPECIES: hypothetical protein [unclassified Streptomyces]|uniref:hypothetical protein n=1 Tax=unclassified Streptomyces TaxID=2593676 RepID=UPI000DAB689C|nr:MULTISPECIES: hypothetical protein [unclassified Streptomyces]PZT72456.1 hypothetical protein DNK55_28425 [Streptomyces sp. AC1-42T]PZT81225.1 hypothetical protein DNK56_03145 [Streptomyces sp. AC1-42W]